MNRAPRSAKALSVGHNRLSGCGSRVQGCGGCLLRGFFAIFLFAGLLTGYFLLYEPVSGMLAARDWDETPCTIRSSNLEDPPGKDDSRHIRIIYDYEYGGLPFVGDRYSFSETNTNTNARWRRQVVKDHPPGLRTVCFVDPDNPHESVLERGPNREMLWGLFPLPFLVIGLGGLLFAPRLFLPKSTANTVPSLAAMSAAGSDDGPLVLKPQMTQATGCLVALFVCLFWNGIVSIFVWQIVASFRDGDPEWFLVVFMIPFVLVGLVLIAVTGHLLLGLFNPRPYLTLGRSIAPLGSLLQVRWEFRGHVRRVRNFKLSLKGEEQATYRRGTDTHTDTQTFFEHVFYEADHPQHIATGEAEFEVPADSMHTFSADNNEIVWTLNVQGDIPNWPDVSFSFPIQVTPHEPVADPDA